MQKPNVELFRFAPLKQYPLTKRLQIYAAGLAGYLLTVAVGTLTRFEGQEALKEYEKILSDGESPIMVFWHDRILLATYFFRNRRLTVLTSRSFDGEYIARIIQRLGYGAIRGSSSRGGSTAVVEAIRAVRQGISVVFTLDGPRGPRYTAKTGPLYVAKKTGQPVMPFIIEARSRWKLPSWDGFQIPWPFTRARILLGPKIYVGAEADDAEMQLKLKELQGALDDLVDQGRNWRKAL